ncbi:MAG: glycosyltransferase family 2 protein [Acidobacteriota bacterium]|nr:MAG: glycosyltransferase family 2 protein [Acidobacteriota bacterium]
MKSPSVSDISIVTVNWNGRHHLERLLPSLLPLGAREILLVDNGSSDGSVEFVRESYPQVRILQNDRNRGFSQPNNWAAREATGDFLAFINNDMRAHPDWLSASAARLETSVCVASRILNWEGDRIDFNGSSFQFLGYALQQDIGKLVDEVRSEDQILFPCGGAMVISRQVFLEAGGFDEDYFAVFEDVDLGWRLWILGHRVHFCPDSLVFHRGHGTFQAHHNAKLRYLMHRNALLTVIKNYETELLTRIFPIAVFQAVKRAVRCSGVQKESLHIWHTSSERILAGDQAAWVEAVDALNHLVALDDVIELLPRMLAKRARIQEHRKRDDGDILKLFKDPLRAIVADKRYISQELDLLELMDLETLFDTSRYRHEAEKAIDPLAFRIDDLRAEVARIQALGVGALLHPSPQTPPSRIRKFLRTWKNVGPKAAIKLLGGAVRRGL